MSRRSKQTDLIPYSEGETVALIALANIDTREQVRTVFDDDSLQELALDIRARGVMQPITVRQVEEGRFLIIAGERRFRAAQIAEIQTIPALVKECTEQEAEDMQLAENIQREDLSLEDEARAIRKLYDREKSVAKVALLVNKSAPWVSKRLAATMPDLGVNARQLMEDGTTSDMEIIQTVSKIEKEFGYFKAMEAKRAVQEGTMNRAKAREYLKELRAFRAQVDAEREDTEESTPRAKVQQAQQPREPEPWEYFEKIEEKLAELKEQREEFPNFFSIGAQFAPDIRATMLDEYREIFDSMKTAAAQVHERTRFYEVMKVTRQCFCEWQKAAAYLAYAGKEYDLGNMIEEYWNQFQ